MANMEMKIASIHSSIRANEGRQIVLQEKGKNRYLPIWIGVAEACIIASKTRGLSMPRPHAHDFVCAVIDALGGTMEAEVPTLADEEVLAKAGIVLEPAAESPETTPRGTADEQSVA